MHFWGNIFDFVKDRRGPMVFMTSLAVFVGLLVVGAMVFHCVDMESLKGSLAYIGPPVLLVLMGMIVRAVRETRARARQRYRILPLSRDELNKARSKLKRAKC